MGARGCRELGGNRVRGTVLGRGTHSPMRFVAVTQQPKHSFVLC